MKKTGILLIPVLLLLGLTSCSENIIQTEEKAYVSFSAMQLSRDAVTTLTESEIAWDDIVQIDLKASQEDSESPVIEESWVTTETLSALESMEASGAIEVKPGTYTFSLDLYAKTNLSELHLVQYVDSKTVTLEEGQEVVITFEPEWASTGDLSITFEWNTQSDVVGNNEIGIIKAGLFSLDDNAIEECPVQSLEITSGEELSSAQLTCKDLPVGNYRLKYWLYNADEEALRYGAMTALVKINGFETVKTITIDTEHLNYIYDIPYTFTVTLETLSINNEEYSLTVSDSETDQTITFTAPEGFASYKWYVGGVSKTVEDETAQNVLKLSKLDDFEAGINQIWCLVTDDSGNLNQIEANVTVTYDVEEESTVTAKVEVGTAAITSSSGSIITYEIVDNICTLTVAKDLMDSTGNKITIESVSWAVNGTIQDSSENFLALDLSTLEALENSVTCTVSDGTNSYILTVSITINE
ncbi:MAG: hypothetical protein K5829_14050 [Treponema sp.]|nr:hypothetical protein [Treponema sp.]